MEIEVIKDIIKILYMFVITFYMYIKITNIDNKPSKTWMLVVLASFSCAILYAITNKYFSSTPALLFSALFYGMWLYFILKDKEHYFILSYILALLIVYVVYFISIIIAAIILKLLFDYLEPTNYVVFVVTLVIATLALCGISKIKRVKNGFNFLKAKNEDKYSIWITLLLSGFTIFIYGLMQNKNSTYLNIMLSAGMLLIGSSLFICIKNLITSHYKKHMRDRTIEMQKKEIDEHLDNIENIKAENIRLSTIIHKYNSRISALEKSINKAMDNMNTEFASELSVMLDETTGIGKELEEQTKRKVNIPSTGVFGIDNMFQFMYDECINNDVNFSLKITNNINYLIENIVKKEKLETLIGDHIKDAIIAINSGVPEYKSILCILGIVRDAYEFSVYDTGIDFEIDTLLKLGVEQVTTHKDNGGSGIGFMTTFETMKECGASLIIEEYDKATTHYTKSVTIRFDGKNEYKIYSYRYKEIKKKCKDKRINISGIE